MAQVCFTVNHEVHDSLETVAASAVITLAKSIAEKNGWLWDGPHDIDEISEYWIEAPNEVVPDVLRKLRCYLICPVHIRFDHDDEDVTDSDARRLSKIDVDYVWGLNPEF